MFKFIQLEPLPPSKSTVFGNKTCHGSRLVTIVAVMYFQLTDGIAIPLQFTPNLDNDIWIVTTNCSMTGHTDSFKIS